ncbi:MAG TPA: signal peptide peptidase SppA [Steroidobacteraceae bacterium]|nr:signal peptide peptidase SppA [Steroidobacteraceae bacterium]
MSVRSVLGGMWRGLDRLRRVLHLLLLLFIFGAVIAALHGAAPRVPEQAALLLAPQGTIVEQLSGDPVARAVAQARGSGRPETLLWDLTDAIRAAAHDPRIRLLVLNLDQMDGAAGQPTLEELARAIRDFRASGKKVVAYGSAYLRDQYYLAAQADEIDLDPLGYVLIDGYSRYRMYYKDVLAKLGVDINVFRVGQYKSAVEEYTRSDMSQQDREESLAYLDALWSAYQQSVSAARHLPADALSRYIAAIPQALPAAHGDAALMALQAHLVTAVKPPREVEKELQAVVGADEDGSFRSITAEDYDRAVHAGAATKARERVGVIVAEGDIEDGTQPPGTIGGDSLARLIRQARMDDRIRAVVLRVDSPGGSVDASEQIYRELVALEQAGKPLVVSMSNYAASGGYYISAPADEIWASPATITGSIGIFAVVPTISRTLQKIGVGVDGVGTTPIAGTLSIERPLSDEAKTVLQQNVEFGYGQFLQRVASGRHKPTAAIDAIGQGRVWAGRDAAANGLVDHLGSFGDAVKAAARRAHLTDYGIEFLEPQLTWTQQLAMQLQAQVAGAVARLGARLAGGSLDAAVQPLSPLLREVQRLRRFAAHNRLYAYCFCSAR